MVWVFFKFHFRFQPAISCRCFKVVSNSLTLMKTNSTLMDGKSKRRNSSSSSFAKAMADWSKFAKASTFAEASADRFMFAKATVDRSAFACTHVATRLWTGRRNSAGYPTVKCGKINYHIYSQINVYSHFHHLAVIIMLYLKNGLIKNLYRPITIIV